MQQSNCCLTTVDRVAVFACFAKSSPRQRGDEPCSSPQTQASPCTGQQASPCTGQQASPCTGPTRDARSAGTGQRGRRERSGAVAQRSRVCCTVACCTAACCTSRGRQPLGYSDRPGRWSQPGSHRPNPRAQDRSAVGPRAAGTAYLMLNKGKKDGEK